MHSHYPHTSTSPRTTPPSPSPFFFPDSPPTELYTLSLHDALPISLLLGDGSVGEELPVYAASLPDCSRQSQQGKLQGRSEEHTSELQSHVNLVCRLLLEKKKVLISLEGVLALLRLTDVTCSWYRDC